MLGIIFLALMTALLLLLCFDAQGNKKVLRNRSKVTTEHSETEDTQDQDLAETAEMESVESDEEDEHDDNSNAIALGLLTTGIMVVVYIMALNLWPISHVSAEYAAFVLGSIVLILGFGALFHIHYNIRHFLTGSIIAAILLLLLLIFLAVRPDISDDEVDADQTEVTETQTDSAESEDSHEEDDKTLFEEIVEGPHGS